MLNRNAKQKMKTLCTIETSDIDLQDNKPGSQTNVGCSRKQKHNSNQSPNAKRKNNCKIVTPTQNNTNKFFNSTHQIQIRSPESKSKNKSKSSFYRTLSRSKSRMKTEYSTASNDLIIQSLLCKSANSLKHKSLIPFQEQYYQDTYQILEEISKTKKQRIYIARKGEKLFVMRKSKNSVIKRYYENQALIKSKFFHSKWKNIIKPVKVYCERNWMYLIQEHHGSCLSWQNSSHLQLISKLLKNEGIVLKFIIKQICKGINQLSLKGYCHNAIRFQNISMKIQQLKRTINVEGNIKLSNLGHCFNIRDKSKLIEMPCNIYTPPEVINLKLFQNQQKFDRQLIEYIAYYDDPWYIDVWALGILILQLIAGQSISIEKTNRTQRKQQNYQSDEDEVSFDVQKQQIQMKPIPYQSRSKEKYIENKNQITLSDILQAQKSLLIQTESQIQKINFDKKFQALLIRMLSINPLNRPSPKQIIKDLL